MGHTDQVSQNDRQIYTLLIEYCIAENFHQEKSSPILQLLLWTNFLIWQPLLYGRNSIPLNVL